MKIKKSVVLILCGIMMLVFCVLFIGQGITSVEVIARNSAGETEWSYRTTERAECQNLWAVINEHATEVKESPEVKELEYEIRYTFSFLVTSRGSLTVSAPEYEGKMVVKGKNGYHIVDDEGKAIFEAFIRTHRSEEE